MLLDDEEKEEEGDESRNTSSETTVVVAEPREDLSHLSFKSSWAPSHPSYCPSKKWYMMR